MPLPSVDAATTVTTARYVSLSCSFLVALSAGSNYGFSSYSPQLQERLHLTSTQINIVGVMGNMGVYLSGPLWGRLVDRKGPRVALATGAVLVLLGYGGLSASYEGQFGGAHATPLATLALFALASGLGNCAAFTAAMNAQAKSWREERRGLCTALVLSGFGLSAFFYSTLSHTLFPGQTGDYLLLLAFGSSLSFLVGFAMIRILPPDLDGDATVAAQSPVLEQRLGRRRSSQVFTSEGDGDEEDRRPTRVYMRRRTSSDIGGRAYAFAAQANEDEEDDDDDAFVNEVRDEYGERVDSIPRRSIERQGLLQHGAGEHDDPSATSSQGYTGDAGTGLNGTASKLAAAKQIAKSDKTGWRLVRDPDFLLLFLIMTIISGTGLLVINNIGTMTRTLYEYNKVHHPEAAIVTNVTSLLAYAPSALPFDMQAFREGDVQQLQAHQVSAISVGNALGRIIMGLLSDVVVNKMGDTRYRVYLLLLVCTLAIASQGVAAWPNIIRDLKKLFGMSIVTGLMYGTLFGLCPVLTFEWFGLRHFSQNWGIISLSPVLAGNVFNLLFGKIYDSHVPSNGPSHLCPDGEECFRAVFRFTAFGAVLALLLSAILISRRAGWPACAPRSTTATS